MEIKVRGRLGNDPELKTVGPDNTEIVTFSLAHTARHRKNGEWQDGETTWYRVARFGTSAQAILENLHKGDEVLVIGALKMNTYTDKAGATKTQMEITASDVAIVPKAKKKETKTEGWDTGW